MIDFNLIDSSVWLAYLEGEELVAQYIDSLDSGMGVATSVITLFEVAKRYKKLKYPLQKIKTAISLIKERSVLFNVDEEIVNLATDFSNSLSIADALIYATSQLNKFTFLTKDNDFRNLPNVKILV